MGETPINAGSSGYDNRDRHQPFHLGHGHEHDDLVAVAGEQRYLDHHTHVYRRVRGYGCGIRHVRFAQRELWIRRHGRYDGKYCLGIGWHRIHHHDHHDRRRQRKFPEGCQRAN